MTDRQDTYPTEAVKAAFAAALGKRPTRPTSRQIDAAINVLGWLSEDCDDGSLRDDISRVIVALEDRLSP